MKESIIHVHGKSGSAEEPKHYKPLFPNCEIIERLKKDTVQKQSSSAARKSAY